MSDEKEKELEKELFNLAKNYVMLEVELNRNLNDFEQDEVKEQMDKIRNTLFEKKYNVDKFVYYQKLYKEMSIGEYFEFIKIFK